MGHLFDWWRALPEGVQEFAASDLAYWIAASIVLVAIVLARRLLLRPRARITRNQWRTERSNGAVVLEGRISVASVGSAFVLSEARCSTDIGPAMLVNPRGLPQAYQGAQDIEVCFRLDDVPEGVTEVDVDAQVKLADGSKGRDRRRISFQ